LYGFTKIQGINTDTKLQRFTDDNGGLIPKVNVKSAALAKLIPDEAVGSSKTFDGSEADHTL
jgi:hypothetical protein